jgi:hypothetical protein
MNSTPAFANSLGEQVRGHRAVRGTHSGFVWHSRRIFSLKTNYTISVQRGAKQSSPNVLRRKKIDEAPFQGAEVRIVESARGSAIAGCRSMFAARQAPGRLARFTDGQGEREFSHAWSITDCHAGAKFGQIQPPRPSHRIQSSKLPAAAAKRQTLSGSVRTGHFPGPRVLIESQSFFTASMTIVKATEQLKSFNPGSSQPDSKSGARQGSRKQENFCREPVGSVMGALDRGTGRDDGVMD